MARAATAKRFDAHSNELLRPLASKTLRDAAPLDRVTAQLTAFGVFAATPMPALKEMTTFCDATSMAEPQRRLHCDHLATVLIETDSTTSGFSIGVSIGQRAGWPAERLPALKEEREAMNLLLLDERLAPQKTFGCEALALTEQHSSDILRLGEVNALRRRMAETGRPVAELARAVRERQGR